MSQNLDRAKPLWEMWVVEGLDEGRWALLSKVHHAMVDGVAGTDLMTVLLDKEREPSAPPGAAVDARSGRRARRDCSPTRSLERAANPFGRRRAARRARCVRRASSAACSRTPRAGWSDSPGVAPPSESSSLNGPLGPHRRWGWARGRLSDVQLVRQALGGTVNDVVLAAITNGFRELL